MNTYRVRSYLVDLKLGDQEFPKGKVVDVEMTKALQAAIKGGLIQVVKAPFRPLRTSANETPSPTPSSPSPQDQKVEQTVVNGG